MGHHYCYLRCNRATEKAYSDRKFTNTGEGFLVAFSHSVSDLFPRIQGVCLLPVLISPKALKVNLMTMPLPGKVTVKKFNQVWLDGTCASDCDRVACENTMSLLQKRKKKKKDNLTEPDFQKGIFKYVPSETFQRIITEPYRN